MRNRLMIHPRAGMIQTEAEWRELHASMPPEEWGGKRFRDAGLVDYEVYRNRKLLTWLVIAMLFWAFVAWGILSMPVKTPVDGEVVTMESEKS